MKRFVIFAAPRTGSSSLIEVLDKSPDVVCHGEIFHNDALYLRPKFRTLIDPVLQAKRLSEPMVYLEAIERATLSLRPRVSLIGCKIFEEHAERLYRRFLVDPGVAKIFLYRENKLAQYSSGRIAKSRGYWAKTPEHPQDGADDKVEFRAAHFQGWLGKVSAYEAQFANDSATTAGCFRIEQRQVADPGAIERLLAFLGARPPGEAATPAPARRTNDVLGRFSNPDEVCEMLKRVGHPEWATE